MKSRFLVGFMCLLLTVTLTACSKAEAPTMNNSADDSSAPQSDTSNDSDTATAGNVKEFTMTSEAYKFTPNTLNVKQGDTVRITVTNKGGFHNFVLDEFNIKKDTPAGQSTVIEFVADKKGSFEYYCGIQDHRAMGQKGTLVVE